MWNIKKAKQFQILQTIHTLYIYVTSCSDSEAKYSFPSEKSMATKMLITAFFIITFIFTLFPTLTTSLPFVVFHGNEIYALVNVIMHTTNTFQQVLMICALVELLTGIADQCNSKRLQNLTATLSSLSGAHGDCMYVSVNN